MTRIRSITKEKIDVLYLRTNLPYQYHLQVGSLPALHTTSVADRHRMSRTHRLGLLRPGVQGAAPGQVLLLHLLLSPLLLPRTVAVKRYLTQARFMKSEVEMFCREVNLYTICARQFSLTLLTLPTLLVNNLCSTTSPYIPGGDMSWIMLEGWGD